MKLTEAEKILKNTYLSLVSDRTSGKKARTQSKRVVCLKCGRGDKTLYKIANGYICNNCLRELEVEV